MFGKPLEEEKTNKVANFIGKFIKKEKEESDNTEIEIDDETESRITEACNDLIASYTNLKRITNFEEYPKASLIYEFYINIAKTKITVEDIVPNKQFLVNCIRDVEDNVLDEICLLYTFVSGYKFEEIHDIISQIIENKVDEAQFSYSEGKKDLTEATNEEKELIENLSEDAKKYHEKFGCEYSLENFNNLLADSKTCSPLVASLVLEIILNINNVKTPDDINKFGIDFTDDDVKEYKDLISNTIIPNIENFLTNSMNFIIIKRS